MQATAQATRSLSRKPVRRVIIAGGGTAGWMSAALLSKSLGKRLEITLVESDEIGTVGVGEATIPTMITFHNLLELKEAEFMAATNATFKLGISFENWRNVGEHYIHSFGETGIDHWTAGFQHFWHAGRQRGLAREYGDYCLELKAAQAERFAHLPDNGMNYAYHLDASAYARFLRKFSEGFGVKRVEGKIGKVNLDEGSGDIASLTMSDGRVLEADLFLDCTGFRSLLLGEAMGVPYEDWSHLLLCDSALAVQTESTARMVPYTRSIAHGAGWQWQIPLQTRVGNGHVYSSRYVGDDEARATLLSNLDSKPVTEPRLIRFTPGQRAQTWKGNCIAFGLSSGFLEPIESTSIHLVSRNLTRLMQLFPNDGISQADIDEYNIQCANEMVHIRDFIILHYHVTNRQDTPFWRDCRAMQVPDTLRHRIALFRETGRVFRVPAELFAENSWIQVMIGQGLVPDSHHQSADLMPDEELRGFLDSISNRVDHIVRQLPQHKEYVRRYCAG
ncbi:MAG: tryptophan halogenase family protein [Gammaproteobacteria bacterium]